ncbi:hypothetical protein WJX77_009617 [Trebouxia sp. C0004]
MTLPAKYAHLDAALMGVNVDSRNGLFALDHADQWKDGYTCVPILTRVLVDMMDIAGTCRLKLCCEDSNKHAQKEAEYTLQDRCNRDGGGANCTQAVSHNCPNALKLGFNMLDVLKWYKGGCGLINESYTNLYVAEGTGNITATTGSRAYG